MAARRSRCSISLPALIGAVVLACGVRTAAAETVEPRFWGTDGPVNAVAVSGKSVYVGGSFSWVAPMTGGGVPLSPRTGLPLPSFPKVDEAVYAAVPDGAGGWFIAGSFTHVAGLPRDNLAHVLVDGSVADWNPGLRNPFNRPNGVAAFALALKGTTLYVGGFFSKIGTAEHPWLGAVDVVTGEAKPWDPRPDEYVTALCVKGNTLYVGGRFYHIAGEFRAHIAAFDATSGDLSDWDPGANDVVNAIATAGNVVYAGGEFIRIGGLARNRLAALDARTGKALAWNPAPNDKVYAIAASGRTVYVGGWFSSIGGRSRQGIAAVDAARGLATAWNTNVAFGGVYGLAPHGSALYAIGGTAVAALDARSGTTNWCTHLNRKGVVVMPGGDVVYAGGDFSSAGERVARACLAAFDLGTGAVTAWSPRANGPVRALATSGGRIWVGGQFTTINGEPRQGLAAVDPLAGTSWDAAPGTDGHVRALAARGETLYAGGSFAHVGVAARSNLAAVDTREGGVAAWDPGANDLVTSLAVDGSTLYAGGAFTLAGGGGARFDPRGHAAAFDATSGEIMPWDPEPNGSVDALLPGAEWIYLGGQFSSVAGAPEYGLAAVDRASGALGPWPAWMSNYDGRPNALALASMGSAVWVGGRFQFLGGYWRYHFGAVDAVTGVATPWDPLMGGTALALAASGNMLFVGGGFGTVGGYPCDNFAAIRVGDTAPPGPAARIASAAPAASAFSLACAPNPSRAGTVLRFTLPVTASATLAVYDLAGRRVTSLLKSASLPAGPHEVRLETRGWRPGVYLCRLEAGERALVSKLVVTR